MINELTGLLNYSKINEYKNSVRVSEQLGLQQKRVNKISAYNANQGAFNWPGEYHSQEISDVKKILEKHQNKGEDFKTILQKACDALKKR